VCDIKPHKKETHRTRLTVGGNLLPFDGNLSVPGATVTTTKCMVNSIISTPKAKGLVLDISNFYLNNALPSPEWMSMPISIIPQEIIKQYELENIVDENGMVWIKIVKGMYGLKQAGIIANQELRAHLKPYGYAPVQHTPGLWRCTQTDSIFTLVVDDFLIQYTSIFNAHHLIDALQKKYVITIDWEAKIYIGITLKWDYDKRKVQLSMPKYVPKALERIGHIFNGKPEHSPAAHTPINYGSKVQYAELDQNLPLLGDKEIKMIQIIVGIFIYYGIAIDNTILVTLNDIAAEQSKATSKTTQKIVQLLNYLATHPLAIIEYHASDMVLHIHSDGSYLSAPRARSRAGGVHFLSDTPPPGANFEHYTPLLNGLILK